MNDYQFLQAAGVFILLCIATIFGWWLKGWLTSDDPFTIKRKKDK